MTCRLQRSFIVRNHIDNKLCILCHRTWIMTCEIYLIVDKTFFAQMKEFWIFIFNAGYVCGALARHTCGRATFINRHCIDNHVWIRVFKIKFNMILWLGNVFSVVNLIAHPPLICRGGGWCGHRARAWAHGAILVNSTLLYVLWVCIYNNYMFTSTI